VSGGEINYDSNACHLFEIDVDADAEALKLQQRNHKHHTFTMQANQMSGLGYQDFGKPIDCANSKRVFVVCDDGIDSGYANCHNSGEMCSPPGESMDCYDEANKKDAVQKCCANSAWSSTTGEWSAPNGSCPDPVPPIIPPGY
jgi:hypothetical protein